MHPRTLKKIKGASTQKRGISAETVEFIRWQILGIRPTDERIQELTGIDPREDPEAFEEYQQYLDYLSEVNDSTVARIKRSIIFGTPKKL